MPSEGRWKSRQATVSKAQASGVQSLGPVIRCSKRQELRSCSARMGLFYMKINAFGDFRVSLRPASRGLGHILCCPRWPVHIQGIDQLSRRTPPFQTRTPGKEPVKRTRPQAYECIPNPAALNPNSGKPQPPLKSLNPKP